MSENVEPTAGDLRIGDTLALRVRNIGGIEDCSITFDAGISVLTGRNATNRTSLLRAIAGVFGGSRATLKSDADSGFVELSANGETYRREYTRHGSSVITEGAGVSDRTVLVDSFASLLGDNPARLAVQRDGDLRDVLMEPVDYDDIQRQIREVDREIDRLEDHIERIEGRTERLPELEQTRADRREELEAIEATIEAVEAEIEAYDADESEAREAEQVLEDLEDARSRRSRTQRKLERQETELERLRDKRADRQADLSAMSVPDEQLGTVEREIQRLSDRKRDLQNDVANLTEVIQFNDDLLSGTGPAVADLAVDDEVTSSLDPMAREVQCWTCGSQVELGQIDDRIDGLRDILADKRASRNEIDERLSELEAERRDLERAVNERADLERTLEEVEREIDHREAKADELAATLTDLDEEIAAIESEVENTDELRDSDLADAYQRLSELEYDRGQVQERLDDVEAEIHEIETDAERLDELRSDLTTQRERRQELRTYIDDLEREIVEQFNEHMGAVRSSLEYENIARIWIERKGNAAASERAAERFELHIVRETTTGTGYEDVIHNLSESEREIIGLVVGLVGYLVHDVHEEVPILLLDSLEAIDAGRIRELVEYFADYAPYLIVAMLPEDERALDIDHHRVDADEI